MLQISHLYADYGGKPALEDINLTLESGELLVVLGPSGCGKTTLLNLIAGFVPYQHGSIQLAGKCIEGPGAERGVVFQNEGLLPWRNVVDNVAFGLQLAGVEKVQRLEIAHQMLKKVGLEGAEKRYIWQLSGGQRQRVGIARALAANPQLLLLDEPFGALDAQVRKELRRWLRQLHEELKFTSVFVTHDQEEAMEVANRVVVMSQGNIEQADEPDQVWREPATRFVLEFMGEVNRLQGTIRGGQFHVGAHRWPLGYTPAYQGPVDLFLRPWEVDISRRTSLDSPLPVQVLEASPKGHYTQLVVQPLGWYEDPLTVVMRGDDAPVRGDRLFVGLQHARLYNGDERIETRDEELALAQSA
ncbi:sulfate/thiosulfate ABC transporter ATP-binding protein CysA [Escherichia coli]|nr:sulfate/thiosulfate ABC transporter ATP-binding protein CysA [Escherichia coli]NAR00628.1 sulfate/thiosulfate ABC transporter ATP-binding protein CysA [Escherichia coli]